MEKRRDKHFVNKRGRAGDPVRGQTYVTRSRLVWLRDHWLAKLAVDARQAERAPSLPTLDL
ncbi:hypothetical protein [Methylorubrum thiocyanatum]|uniref:hypothetical protein n=1 Tax=Methylorubrum thiocyanatum TaxID=47958 RepID=UPI0035C83D8B